MASVSVFVPEDLKKKMAEHEEVNWSGLIRRTISAEIEKLEFLDKLASKSRLTEKDAVELGRKLNASVAKRHEGA